MAVTQRQSLSKECLPGLSDQAAGSSSLPPVCLESFAAKLMQEERCLAAAEKIAADEPLCEEDVLALMQASLPVLAKLIEWYYRRHPRLRVGIHPVSCLPLCSLLEMRGMEGALRMALDQLDILGRTLAEGTSVKIIIDKWTTNLGIERLIDLIERLLRRNSCGLQISIIGPSTAEMKQLLLKKTLVGSPPEEVTDLLRLLKNAGISSIDGGGDVEMHLKAAALGLSVSVAQRVTNHTEERPESANSTHSTHLEDLAFVEKLMSLRKLLLPTEKFTAWSPWSPSVLDTPETKPQRPLALHLLRAISAGRLVLSEIEQIRAPACLLGARVAEIALHFGANDLGYAAIDQKSGRLLGLPLYSEISHLQFVGE